MMKRFDLRSQSTQIRLAWLLLGLLMIGYTLWMSQQAVLRYDTFKATAFDLGNMDQVIWNTAHGYFFQWTNQGADWYGPPIRLAQHFEPILLLLSLLYLLHSDPRVLLIFQTLALMAGALPVFLLTRAYLPRLPILAPIMAAAYLLSPALIGLNIFDFHPVSLATSLLLYAVLALTYRRYGWFLLACILAAASKEDVPFTVALLGILVIWKYKLPRLGSVLVVGGLLWGLLAFLVIIPHFYPGQHNNFWYRYESFGSSPAVAVVNILLHPWILFGTFFTLDRFYYLANLLRSGGFLALLGPEWLLPALPGLAENLLSIDDPLLYSGVYHYNATIIPFVVLASLQGLVRVVTLWQYWRGEAPERPEHSPALLLPPLATPMPLNCGWLVHVVNTVALFVMRQVAAAWLALANAATSHTPIARPAAQLQHGVVSLSHLGGTQWQHFSDRMVPLAKIAPLRRFQWFAGAWIVAMIVLNYCIMIPWFNVFWADHVPGTREQHIQQLLDMIPPDASVSAGVNLNPHLSERRFVTVFPSLTYSVYPDTQVEHTVQYIIVDLTDIFPEDQVSATTLLNQLCQSKQFRIVKRAEGVILLARNNP